MPLIMQYKTGTGAPPSGGGSTTPNCTAPHFLDNTYWTNQNDMFWDGTQWICTGSSTQWQLGVTGSWATGYRPTTMEFKFIRESAGIDTNATEFIVRDTNSADISAVYDLDTYALDTIHTISAPLTFTTFDIASIYGDNFMYSSGFKILCINFT